MIGPHATPQADLSPTHRHFASAGEFRQPQGFPTLVQPAPFTQPAASSRAAHPPEGGGVDTTLGPLLSIHAPPPTFRRCRRSTTTSSTPGRAATSRPSCRPGTMPLLGGLAAWEIVTRCSPEVSGGGPRGSTCMILEEVPSGRPVGGTHCQNGRNCYSARRGSIGRRGGTETCFCVFCFSILAKI